MARADGDPLLLPAADLPGQLVRLRRQPDGGQRLVHPACHLRLRAPLHAQPEADILAHRHMGEQGIVLENHTEAPGLRRQRIHPPVIQPYAAPRQGQQSGEAVQRRAFPAAGWPKQGDELPPPDSQGDIAQRVQQAEIPADPV